MTRSESSTTAGFTIVETLLVLAIAGVFLLVVFDAIPALERNSANSQRRQDVSTILEAVSHYELNNSGNFPPLCGDASTDLCYTNPSDPLHFSSLGSYDDTQSGNVEMIPQTAITGHDVHNTLTADQVWVYNYEKCNPDNSGDASTAGAGYNDVVALFAVEGASAPSPQCREL
jgi:type II secretory pathway pseudopilin PulG